VLLSLKTQTEGISAKQTCKYAACKSIDMTSYIRAHGIILHQGVHNELAKLEEPVPETNKVADFLKGIYDSFLKLANNSARLT
jgi:hypothetical protein